MIWFTADTHFSHGNIIKYCRRPFVNANEMNEVLIENWNSVVAPDDIVWHLGDWSFAPRQHARQYNKHLRNQLNGSIHLVLGNHDHGDSRYYEDIGMTSVHYPYVEVEGLLCVHDPSHFRNWPIDVPFLCGHVHENWSTRDIAINVGVDVRGFKPISIDEIREIVNDLRPPQQVPRADRRPDPV